MKFEFSLTLQNVPELTLNFKICQAMFDDKTEINFGNLEVISEYCEKFVCLK